MGEDDYFREVAGGLLRASIDGNTYDLRIDQVSPRSDAGGDPPACLDKTGSVQFNLNWAATDLKRALPAVQMTLQTTDGTPLVYGDPPTAKCAPMVKHAIRATKKNTQYILAMALPKAHGPISKLAVTINNRTATMPLLTACSDESNGPTIDPGPPACVDGTATRDAAHGYPTLLTVR